MKTKKEDPKSSNVDKQGLRDDIYIAIQKNLWNNSKAAQYNFEQMSPILASDIEKFMTTVSDLIDLTVEVWDQRR